jgi:hypothetical protein
MGPCGFDILKAGRSREIKGLIKVDQGRLKIRKAPIA